MAGRGYTLADTLQIADRFVDLSESRERQKQTQDINRSIGGLKWNPDATATDLGVSESAHLVGRDAVRKDTADQAEFDFNNQVQEQTGKFLGWLRQNPQATEVPQEFLNSAAGVAAVAKATAGMRGAVDSFDQLEATRQERLAKSYQTYQTGMKRIDELRQAGKEDEAAKEFINLSKTVDVSPYVLTGYDAKTKTFSTAFTPLQEGEPVDAGGVTVDELMGQVGNLTQEKFYKTALDQWTTQNMMNVESLNKPIVAKGKNGETVYISPLYDLDGSNGEVHWRVTKEDGSYEKFDNKTDLLRAGYKPPKSLEEQKTAAEIGKIDAETKAKLADADKGSVEATKIRFETIRANLDAIGQQFGLSTDAVMAGDENSKNSIEKILTLAQMGKGTEQDLAVAYLNYLYMLTPAGKQVSGDIQFPDMGTPDGEKVAGADDPDKQPPKDAGKKAGGKAGIGGQRIADEKTGQLYPDSPVRNLMERKDVLKFWEDYLKGGGPLWEQSKVAPNPNAFGEAQADVIANAARNIGGRFRQ